MAQGRLPIWFKLAYSAFVAVQFPIYAAEHGWLNFLWFSNLALIGGLAAAWLESKRLASMLLIAVAMPELFWIVDFMLGLLGTGHALAAAPADAPGSASLTNVRSPWRMLGGRRTDTER